MGATLKFGLGVNANEALHGIVKKSIAAEAVGLDYIWVADSPVQLYAPVIASEVASATHRIRIGLGLMSVLLHAPRQVAGAITTLFEAYGDRFDICIGMGDRRQLERVGVKGVNTEKLPLNVLEARDKIVSHLQQARIRTKIWLGAQAPKMLRIARGFDGVLLNYSNPEMIAWAITEAGLGRKSKTPQVKIGTYSPSYVYMKPESRMLERVKVSSAVVALGASSKLLRRLGLWGRLRRAKRRAETAATMESILPEVPDEVVEYFSVTMKAADLPSYLATLKNLGVGHIVFAYPQNYSLKTVRELGKALQFAS